MKKDLTAARATLPKDLQLKFDGIVNQRILGASRHIAIIGEMIESIALQGKMEQKKSAQIIKDIKKVTEFFIATRGAASQAVTNAILLMTHSIDDYADCEIDMAVDKIIEAKDRYMAESCRAIDRVAEYGALLAKDMKNIFLFDYSNTAEKFLTRLKDYGSDRTIYIAESRAIDGGLPFIKPCLNAGYRVKFFPDAAMMYYLKGCDAAFMGAETYYADGTGFNTIGSDLVALVCAHYHIPLYFLTPMIKLDTRPIYGYTRALVTNDLKDKMTLPWDKEIPTLDIDFNAPELIGVGAEFIEAYVTEKGVIPANQIFDISLAYSRYLRGDKNE